MCNGNGDDNNQMCKILSRWQAEKFELLLRKSVAVKVSLPKCLIDDDKIPLNPQKIRT